jgi:hypothetical protein
MEEKFDYEYKLQDVYFPCIYFLLKNEKVVYVGQTEYGLKRILCHPSDKDFDTIRTIKCKSEKLDEMEMKYIAKYQPLYNKQLPNACSSMRLKQILTHNGLRVRKDIIKRWIMNNVKEYYVFCGEIYVAEKDKISTLNGIFEFINNK